MKELRVFLVDDHQVVRAGLRSLLETQPDVRVVGEAADGQAAVDALRSCGADVVVMDISMPKLGGAEATASIKRAAPEVNVLALTAHEDSAYVQVMLKAGASGFVLKRCAAEELIRAVRVVAGGGLYVEPTTAGHILKQTGVTQSESPPADSTPLSERETEVIRLIAQGHAMKEIATQLKLSPRTLETYKTRAMAKLELTNRAEIVRYALRRGWLDR